jgi:tRNA (cmo5U34)-methyltransferase
MKEDQIKDHFAQQADEYEKLMVRLVPQYLEQHEIIQSLLPSEDREWKVLDLGCGNGVLSELVFDKLPHARVVGFDLTESMLTAYEKKLSRYSKRYELRQGNYLHDSYGNNYDIILAGLTLHHLTHDQRRKFYHELFQSFGDNGLFIARDIIIDEDPRVRHQQYGMWKQFMKSRGEDPELWYRKHEEKDHPLTLTDHYEWLRSAGFHSVGCHWRMYNFAITSAEKGASNQAL